MTYRLPKTHDGLLLERCSIIVMYALDRLGVEAACRSDAGDAPQKPVRSLRAQVRSGIASEVTDARSWRIARAAIQPYALRRYTP